MLFIAVGFSLPPSGASLTKRFFEHQRDLERLVDLMEEDQQVAELTPDTVTSIEGKTFSAGVADAPLSAARWDQYRSLLRAAGVDEVVRGNLGYFVIAYRRDIPRRIRRFLRSSELHEREGNTFADTLGSYAGYVYCRLAPVRSSRLLNYDQPGAGGNIACMEPRQRGAFHSLRYSQLKSQWFLFEVIRANTSE